MRCCMADCLAGKRTQSVHCLRTAVAFCAQARAMGADAALLIAAVLPNTDLAYLLKSAAKLGLQVIIEVHTIAGARQLTLMQLFEPHRERAWQPHRLAQGTALRKP